MSAQEAKERLLQLLEYVQHMVRLPERARLSVKDNGSLVYFEGDVNDRIGVELDVQGEPEPTWLKLGRLARIDPPEPPEEVAPWVSAIKNPFRDPKVASQRTETVTEYKGRELVEIGVVAAEDVKELRKRGPNKEKMVEVKLSLQKNRAAKDAIKQYVSGPWRRWADMEKPRRATMKIYDDFFKLHQSIETGTVEAPIELIWGLGVAVWKTSSGTVKHPLIEARVEMEIDPSTQEIRVRPRDAEPQLFIKPFLSFDVPGILSLQDKAKEHFDGLLHGEAPREFSPFDRTTFEPLLRLATSLLSASAHYYPDVTDDPKDRSLPTPTETLRITDTWAIYARPRSDNMFVEDVERLKEIVTASDFESLNTAARAFVADTSNQPKYQPRRVDLLKGISENEGDEEAGETGQASNKKFVLYFPKEYNDAQVKIIDELEEADGVVVQGPPGTGKTHTIANIICHYLATGRRVLVTSQGEPALKVLREFIPEEIRGLTISLLTKEREGLQQLETAVTLLANEVSRIAPEQIEKQIIDNERQLHGLRAQIEENERQVREIAERQLTPQHHDLAGGSACDPAELAKRLVEERGRHDWLPDEPELDAAFDPQFTAEQVARARQARIRLGADLRYLTSVLPEIGELPDNSTLQEIHEQIIDVDQNDPHAANPDFPKLSALADDARARADGLIADLRTLVEIQEFLAPHTWLSDLFQSWLELGFASAMTKPFDDLFPHLQNLADRMPLFVDRPVSVPDLGDHAQSVANAVARAARRRRPFGVLSVGTAQAKELLAQIKIDAVPPEDANGWRHVQGFLEFCDDARVVAGRWNAIADHFGLPKVDEAEDRPGPWLIEQFHLIVKARHAASSGIRNLRREIPELFPHGIDADEVIADRRAAERAIEILEVNLARDGRASAQDQIDALLRRLEDCQGPIVKKAAGFLRGKVGDQSVGTGEISAEWDSLLADFKRLHSHSRDFEMVRQLADLVEQSGGAKWSEALRTKAVTSDNDPWTPDCAIESWNWKRLATYLKRIDGRAPIRELSRERLLLEAQVKSTLAELVRLRTFLGLYVNMTDRAKSALVRFTAAIRHIGTSGEGQRARRFKRDAREAMNDCYNAVPCWIMPTWRVSETLPSEIGSFDLVIVDEASQSDVLALPTMMRGIKLLIVGDDKQVSPVAPFVEERKLVHLRNQHLSSQIFVDLMMPGSSLYDLANAVFPGRRVMLDEHFRCVEPIIRFSFRFYPEAIIPVRIPKASERLEPPMVDVYVPGGKKDKKKVNRAEATAIVDEIERLVNDPAYRGRSIGVVSLIGAQQGDLIQDLLLRRIGQEKYLEHNIDCGDSATFQGRERDIMFVSMVVGKGRIPGQTAVIYEQRFNVALSRARDRMYLYRSVEAADLNPNDLKSKVIEHFTRPIDDGRPPVENLVELCETDLERAVFERLVALGYRVTPRVTVGVHSIDLVVEGNDDRRLAIELDGDREQTPDGWLDTCRRHKVLERVGWRFWRCWASSFILDEEACVEDLVSTLEELEIEPIGNAEIFHEHSEHREVEESEPDEEQEAEEQALATLAGSGEEEAEEDEEPVVDVGDRILVSYSDEPSRYRTLVIRDKDSDPDNGIFARTDPLSKALLGAAVGDEIHVPLDGDTHRVVTIFQIEKPDVPAAALAGS